VQSFTPDNLQSDTIVGDISAHLAESSALRDFVYEANRGRNVWFLANREELEQRLLTDPS
jgi:hypothetical protein